MLLKAYSVRDSKAGVYNTPFFQRTHGEAERMFHNLVKDPNSTVCKYPDDFDLFHVGEYDDQKGVLLSLDTPQHIQKAAHLISQKSDTGL